MADPQLITTLTRKRKEIEAAIAGYQRAIDAARKDLAHVNATLRLFKVGDAPPTFPVHMGLARLFEYGEVFALCRQALEAAGKPLDTRELARAVAAAKGLDGEDKVLRQALALSIVNALTRQEKRGAVRREGKRAGVVVWAEK